MSMTKWQPTRPTSPILRLSVKSAQEPETASKTYSPVYRLGPSYVLC